jgi:hypothetical protein
MNIRCARLGIVATGVVLAASTILAQEIGYLDLTDRVPRQPIHSPKGGGIGGGCGGGGGDSSAIPEISVTLVSIDKRAYSIGEEVTFEVRIENTGRYSIEIPWTPHLGNLEPSDSTRAYTYRSALLVLTLTDPDSRRSFGLGDTFYGSTEVPGTMEELRPGQSVLIRTRKRLEVYEEWWEKRIKEVQPLPLKASPDLMLNEMTYSPPSNKGDLGSENTRCTPMNTRKSNHLDVVLWARTAN